MLHYIPYLPNTHSVKPRSVSDLTVQYSGGQTAVVEWMYPEPVPLGLEYTLIVKSKWDDHAKVCCSQPESGVSERYELPVIINLD